jgi:site-specific DNA-methyltransferase (adenine-specific)
VVLDPTMGSGTMGVACAKLNRKFIGCELNENIFKVAVNRVNKKK